MQLYVQNEDQKITYMIELRGLVICTPLGHVGWNVLSVDLLPHQLSCVVKLMCGENEMQVMEMRLIFCFHMSPLCCRNSSMNITCTLHVKS